MISVKCGVPKRSTLGSILLLLNINDLSSAVKKPMTIHFANDIHVSYTSKILITTASVTNYELKQLVEWLRSNQLPLDFDGCELNIFRPRAK